MKKSHIAICDSEESSRILYSDFCLQIGQKHNLELSVKTYEDSELLLNDMNDTDFCEILDIIIIEVDLRSVNGIKTAKGIRKAGFEGVIIFLSNSEDGRYYEDIFDVSAFNYVRKRQERLPRFERVFLKAVERMCETSCEYVLLSYGGDRRQIDISTIQYFEILGNHLIRVFYEDKSFDFFSSLDKMEQQLAGHRFCRLHKSFLVSLDYIKQIESNEATMKSGVKIPIGRKNKNNLVSMWKEWRI